MLFRSMEINIWNVISRLYLKERYLPVLMVILIQLIPTDPIQIEVGEQSAENHLHDGIVDLSLPIVVVKRHLRGVLIAALWLSPSVLLTVLSEEL